MKDKTIGIVGGMGANASAYLYQLIIQKSQQNYKAGRNSEYPHIIIDSIPIPEFINGQPGIKAKHMLKESILRLNKTNSSCIGMACNTAHILIESLQAISQSPIINLPQEVAQRASQKNYQIVGLLATSTTIKKRLYQDALLLEGIEVQIPSRQHELDVYIKNIIATGAADPRHLQAYTQELGPVDAIILGCTELSMTSNGQKRLDSLNSLDILADSLLNKYYNRN